jgi:hemerythrin superfamily protein
MHDPSSESESIQAVFTEDHRKFTELGRAILRALESGTYDLAASLWAELETALSIHLHAEDQFMIPALGRARSREARAIAAEHRLIRERLAEISARFKQNQMHREVMRNFVDELDAHARHEEKIFYEWVDTWLDEKERALLFAYRVAASSDSSAASSSSTLTGLVK